MLRSLYVVAALLSLTNALWMLLSPEGWFTGLPAGVPDTGAFNPHLVRDVGVAFAAAAAGFAWCAANVHRCYPVHLGLTFFFVGHALVHVSDLLGHRLPSRHWLLDLPLVFAPALLLALVALPPVWRRVSRAAAA